VVGVDPAVPVKVGPTVRHQGIEQIGHGRRVRTVHLEIEIQETGIPERGILVHVRRCRIKWMGHQARRPGIESLHHHAVHVVAKVVALKEGDQEALVVGADLIPTACLIGSMRMVTIN
jgi:hypothetical protein